MFKRTVTFWRQLLTGKITTADNYATATADNHATATATEEDDRRAWQRYAVNFTTQVQPVKDDNLPPIRARICNISLGGVLFITSRAFTEGELVSIEMTAASGQERATVLACVVHVSRQPDNSWAIGCTFSRELSEDDLQAFGVQRLRHAPSDQRTCMRFRCDLTATCQTVAAPQNPPFTAQVLNISASGVGLLVQQAVANGTLLSAELHASQGNFTRTMLACVVHVTAQAEGGWALGCNFIRSLSEADLKALV